MLYLGDIDHNKKALKKTNEMIKWRTDKSRGETIKYKERDII